MTAYGPWNYLFGDKAVLNIKADHKQFPIIGLSHQVFFKTESLATGREHTTYGVQMYFLTKSTFTHQKDDGTDIAAAQAMELAARRFKVLLQKSQWVDATQTTPPVKMGQGEIVYNQLDANCDGVVVLFDIRLSDEGFDYCFSLPPTT